MCPGIAVVVIDAIAPIPSKLSSNGTAVPIHLAGNLGRIKPLL
jgi:hypothetical protein